MGTQDLIYQEIYHAKNPVADPPMSPLKGTSDVTSRLSERSSYVSKASADDKQVYKTFGGISF